MSDRRVMKEFEQLSFSDNFIFCRVMEDPDLCRKVLECLLQRQVAGFDGVDTQKEIDHSVETKMIKLDVFNEDSEGILYDTEMQNLNKKSIEYHQLPKRMRYYQGSIDIEYMKKGYSYKKLPESNVLFICTFDPFKKGLPQYTFTERCEEDSELILGDGTVKIFYNCCYKGKDIPDDLRDFYRYVETGIVNSDLTRQIDEAVAKGRENESWRERYMREWNALHDAREDAREEGREEGREDDIVGMLRRGKTVEEIVDFCGYPYDQVKKVENDLLATVN